MMTTRKTKAETKKTKNETRKPRINQIDRDRLIDAYVAGHDFLQVAETLNVNRRTASDIILKFKRFGKREALRSGGAPPKKITPEMLQELITFIENKPRATLEQLKSQLIARFPEAPPVSTTTIMRKLD